MTDQTQPIRIAPAEVVNLVNRFTEQRAVYRSGKYNETQLRRDFLDPLCEALGWDVSNRKNLSETNRDVINEMSVEMEGHAKAADYAFKTNNKIFFFLEAKKPSVNIETNPAPAFQLRSYGWTAKLPFSVLSDFEQLAVYDCRVKPVYGDTPLIGRHRLYTYTDYVDKWDELYNLLSYDAVHAGSLEKLVETVKSKRGTADVDDDFLATMEHWREELARVISLRNLSLSQRQINTAVQLIIDRIIFLRICEDRGIEPENGLREATDGVDVYGDLMELFKRADRKYNSGLFHFEAEKGQSSHPDTLTPTLKIDDKVLKDILANLYLPKSPYAFKYFSADILGQVYERFLGKVITLSDGHRSKVIEKPEVRKAGGVYYTPTYIVEYIVRNTVGELLKDKTPAHMLVEPIRVLDPACGSGSFLLGAYQYLLDWYLAWYSANDPVKWSKGKNPPIFDNGGWQLTMEKKKDILTSHIFGVDIDAQAVEVTKLSLLLKVVENPGQLSMLEERILPDLGENIKCGNSLIGPDYYQNQQLTMFDSEEQYRVNAFDWETSFPKAFRVGGFDAVIGNPPYVRQETLGNDKLYYQKHYKVFAGTADLYSYFIEKGVSLLAIKGQFSYIVANKWMRANYGEPLRNWLKNKCIEEIIDFGDLPVFENATTYPCILRISNNFAHQSPRVSIIRTLFFRSLYEYIETNSFVLDQRSFSNEGWSLSTSEIDNILIKANRNSLKLKDFVEGKIFYGIKTGYNEAFVVDNDTKNKLINDDPRSIELIKPFIFGREIKRYHTINNLKFLLFMKHGVQIKNYPAINDYLSQYKDRLMPKPKDFRGSKWNGRKPGNYKWYEIQDTIDYYKEFEKPKIIYAEIASRGQFQIVDDGSYSDTTTYILGTDSKYLLGVLNSKFITFIFSKISSTIRGGFYRWKRQYMELLPIHSINFSDPAEVKQHDRMVALVESMLALHKASADARLPDEKERLARQIQFTDRQIDQLVYQLYGLSDEEIKIIESTS